MTWKLALAGCGNVGTALLEILHRKGAELATRHGFDCRVCLVTDPLRGVALNPEGLDLGTLLEKLRNGGTFNGLPEGLGSFESLLARSGANLFADATPTNLTTGEPGLTHLRVALSRGVHATTSSKGPLAVAAEELESLAKRHGALFRYEGAVMSGTPLVALIRENLAGCAVTKVEGILNGTTNYMLTRMEEGLSYGEALAEAQGKGYAEADPTADVEGWDAAVKVAILSRVVSGVALPVDRVDRTGISALTPEDLRTAKEAGRRIRLVATLIPDPESPVAKVAPERLPLDHPLASVRGATNAATLHTDHLGPITITGPGAGRTETGQALLTDLLAIARLAREEN